MIDFNDTPRIEEIEAWPLKRQTVWSDPVIAAPIRDFSLSRAEDSESAILAAAFIDSTTVPTIADLLAPEDFYSDKHQRIMQAIYALMIDDVKVDITTIVTKLKDLGYLENGLGTYVGKLIDFPAASDIQYHAKRISDTATQRRAAVAVNKLLKDIGQTRPEDIEQKFYDAATGIFNPDRGTGKPPSINQLRITTDELNKARLSPDCVVKDYLFCDVATIAAAGGTGKTTLLLYEMIHIVLGRPLYGLEIFKPGWCLYITAEDSRETCIARLREEMRAMQLTDEEQQIVMERILFWDVSGDGQKKLIELRDGNIELTKLPDDIIREYRSNPPVMVTFDPIVSFGASEKLVNDNEQGLITAARRIMRGLNCCVRFVAHTGKEIARKKTLDQYASRGGSALSDGARMVAVMQSWKHGMDINPPPGCNPAPGSSIIMLNRPKLSYAPPQPLLWIRRTGFQFEYFTNVILSEEDRDKALFDQVERFLESEVAAGKKHSKDSLETALPKGITRADARRAISQLLAQGRIVEAVLPKNERRGAKKKYFTTSARYGEIGKNESNNED